VAPPAGPGGAGAPELAPTGPGHLGGQGAAQALHLVEADLLVPLFRFLPPDDPRVRATVLAIADELAVDGMVLRYRVDQTDDGFGSEEGTFAICSFWLVSALSEIGEEFRARELCEKLLAYAGPLNLYAEQIDARSGRHLGNFPQAFTHLALINAVIHVIRAESRRETGRFLVPRQLTG
jgi:alpha,alpha-trehalase